MTSKLHRQVSALQVLFVRIFVMDNVISVKVFLYT